MNANTMELNLDELEMVTGGDLWNRVKGELVGAAVGCVMAGAVLFFAGSGFPACVFFTWFTVQMVFVIPR